MIYKILMYLECECGHSFNMCVVRVIWTADASTVKPIYRFTKKSEHLRLLIKLGETFPQSICQVWKMDKSIFLCFVTFLHVCIPCVDEKDTFIPSFSVGFFGKKSLCRSCFKTFVMLQPQEILTPWCPCQREPFHYFPWILKRDPYYSSKCALLCSQTRVIIRTEEILCVWVSDLCSACFCCPQNMGLLQDELWFQEITHIVSKFTGPSSTLWTAHFSCF